ncbi:two-component regulator propeller domain-containing protein [Carboxylicivirga sp. M1479]|uniref:hybrid sensor histidine kinase/response regulator transcription factor n=1 Tax=Carboxylicivirga sp. M1479 TaxID=2594476 RepID=UPI001178B925|nr:two-component regulator propeller domain-containing protein [Carboxylicivirga sp. M1479]TRX70342.1 response regulator [Carboxylicivirga sp. M1479]
MNYLDFIRIFIVVVCLICMGTMSYGQDYQLSYYSVGDGLSHNEVTTIIQDDNGFMWFGTRGGLNRFDGYEFKLFTPDKEQEKIIPDVYIEQLFLDSKQRLWIGSKSSGFYYYDIPKDRLITLPVSQELSNIRIHSLEEDQEGNIWIGSRGKGPIKMSPDTQSLEFVSLESRLANALTSVQDSFIFWGTQIGLEYYDKSDEIKNVLLKDKRTYHEPFDMIADPQSPYLWIVGAKLALTRFNYTDGTYKTYQIPSDRAVNAPSYSLMSDNNGDLWIGTLGNGLYKFKVKDETFEKIKIRPDGISDRNNDYEIILDIYQDKAGDIWIGTKGGGIIKVSPKRIFYSQSEHVLSEINDLHINSVLEDRDGILWVGTKGQGVFMLNEQGRFQNVPFKKQPSFFELYQNDVRKIYQSEDGLIWLSFDSGIYIIVENVHGRNELVYVNDYFNSQGLSKNMPRDLVVLDQHLWLATKELGLFMFQKEDGTYRMVKNFWATGRKGAPQSNSISVLNVDHKQRLWVGTHKGLYQYQPTDTTLVPLEALLHKGDAPLYQAINCIYVDHDGDIWFGTPGGLHQLVEGLDGMFQLNRYTKLEGLVNTYINTVLSDSTGDIWLSTNAGLSCYHKQSGEFINYDASDGLEGTNFSESSGCIGRNGRLYFGGRNGLLAFNPSDILNNNYQPPIVISECKILNKTVSTGGKVLKFNINQPQTLELNHLQNEISFEFAALDYKAPHLNQYAYWLEGRDSTQVFLGNRRYLSFSNLKPGDYILHLYGTNSNGIWSDQERTINLNILSAPWKTWYANVMYVFLILLIVFIIVRVARKQDQLNRSIELEQLMREKQKQVNEDKLRFFTNISHEIRTPLTLILAPFTELLQKDFSKVGYDFIKNKVELVHQNAAKLLELVNQLMEFRKLEAQKVQLQASEGNIVGFINQLCEPFEAYAESKHIRFKKEYKQKEASLYFDNEKMAMVINNLLSNAFKFAGQPGKVTVRVEERDEAYISISISNNGKGISSSDLKFLFERFYYGVSHSSMESSGIGLSLVKGYVELHKGDIEVESDPGELTTFTLKLLKGKTHLLADEISSTPTKLKKYKSVIDRKQTEVVIKPKKALSGATVLIVEDNEELRGYLKEFLGNYFKVIVAEDGLEGFERVIGQKPELVVSDVMMPRMDGFELCQKIKSNPLVAHTPVILLTAKGTTKDEVLGTQHGADAYLKKPFDTNLLLGKMNMLIESRRKLSDNYADKVILAPKDMELEKDDAKFIKKLMVVLEENIGNADFNQEQLAERMAVGYRTLVRKCRKIIDQTPSAFIKSFRLKRAAQLLENSDLTVTEIMDEVAYSEIKTFRRNFKAEFKMSPSDYRRHQRG